MKPKIAFIHKAFPYSGAERVTIDVANGLTDRGYDVVVLTPQHCIDRYPKGIECKFRVVEMPPCNLKTSKAASLFLCDYIRQNGISVIVSYRELLYMDWLKRQTGCKFVYVLHNMVGYEFSGGSSALTWFNTLLYRNKYRRIFRQADAYGVLCPQYKSEVLDMVGSSADENKLFVLPNPITIAVAPQDVNLQKQKEILYVGRLSHRDKRVDRLLRIWKIAQSALPDWHLTIVGSGKKENALRTMAERLSLANVRFEGQQSQVQPYYDRASVLCLTSSFEGWPMSIGEAQMNGVIPVLFDSFAGAHDMVSSPDEGILIPPYDEEAFAEALISLCNSPQELKRLQEGAIAKSRLYNVERTCNAWEIMLERL